MKKTEVQKRMKLPRGMRNNNPLNIRRSKTKWVGEVPKLTITEYDPVERRTDIVDSVFCQFQTLEHGWRAAFLLLKKYINVYKLNTVRKIIKRWAPPSENATAQYINDVCFQACILSDTEVCFGDMDVMLRIGAAMCVVENGAMYDPTKCEDWMEALRGGYRIALHNEQFNVKQDKV